MAAKEPATIQTVREAHRHEDGTLIAPPKQTPDPEEIQEIERPSLGRILLREAEALRAEQEAKRVAQEAAEANRPVSITLPQLHTVADKRSAKSDLPPCKSTRFSVKGTPTQRRRILDKRIQRSGVLRMPA